MSLTPAQTKRIEDALCAAAIDRMPAPQLAQLREALVKEFEALKLDAAKTAASTK